MQPTRVPAAHRHRVLPVAFALSLFALATLAAALGPASRAAAVDIPPAIEYVVRSDIADRTGGDASRVEIVESVPVTWSDSCLGLGGPATSCLREAFDGYVVWAALDDEVFRYHAESHGNDVRFAAQGLTRADVGASHLPAGATLRTQSYTVQPGDTLAGIAARFRVSVAELAAANGIARPELIYPGTRLRIPRPGEFPTTLPVPPPPPATSSCTNPVLGYAVAFPPGWYANAGGTSPCSLFARQIPVSAAGGAPIRIERSGLTLTGELQRLLRTERMVSMTEVRVGNMPAVRMESTAGAGSVFAAGTTVTRYLVALPSGGTLRAETFGGVPADYAARRVALGWLMATLRFTG